MGTTQIVSGFWTQNQNIILLILWLPVFLGFGWFKFVGWPEIIKLRTMHEDLRKDIDRNHIQEMSKLDALAIIEGVRLSLSCIDKPDATAKILGSQAPSKAN